MAYIELAEKDNNRVTTCTACFSSIEKGQKYLALRNQARKQVYTKVTVCQKCIIRFGMEMFDEVPDRSGGDE